MVYANRGFPSSGRMFFPASPFDPPLAQIVARTLGLGIFARRESNPQNLGPFFNIDDGSIATF